MNEKIMQLVHEIKQKTEELEYHIKKMSGGAMGQRGGYYGRFPEGGMNFRDGQGGGSYGSGSGSSGSGMSQRGGGDWEYYPPGFDPRLM